MLCNLLKQLRVLIWQSTRVVIRRQQRMAVVGNGNIDVGKQTPTRKPGQPIDRHSSESSGFSELRLDNPPKTAQPAICGAMSQQGGDFRGNVSAPQKFVHLVGCRDPEASLRQKSYGQTRLEQKKA
jgi:hypothetical protein